MKKPISATIEEDLIRWVDAKVKSGTAFRNRSHLIETALAKMKAEDSEEKGRKKNG